MRNSLLRSVLPCSLATAGRALLLGSAVLLSSTIAHAGWNMLLKNGRPLSSALVGDVVVHNGAGFSPYTTAYYPPATSYYTYLAAPPTHALYVITAPDGSEDEVDIMAGGPGLPISGGVGFTLSQPGTWTVTLYLMRLTAPGTYVRGDTVSSWSISARAIPADGGAVVHISGTNGTVQAK